MDKIIKQKILNQALMLKKYGFCTEEKLVTYADELEYFDNTNREVMQRKYILIVFLERVFQEMM